MMHAALRDKELEGILDAHGQNLADILALEENAQRFRVEAPAAADIAKHLHIRQEAHFDSLHALAFARLAAAASGVEREGACGESAYAGFRGLSEQPPDRIPETNVSCRAGARRFADGSLIHFEHAAERLPTGNFIASLKDNRAFAHFLGTRGPRQQTPHLIEQ